MTGNTASAPLLLAGATGLVGGCVLERFHQRYPGRLVLAPTRRELAHARRFVHNPVVDLADPAVDTDLTAGMRIVAEGLVGTYLCCLGTTIKSAGSKDAFAAVDLELMLRLARVARELGARQAILVSSVGANTASSNFYLATKGRAEDGLAALGFDRVDILRPGLLLGERSESRRGEAIAQLLTPLYNPLLRGPLRRYRSIAASTVANAAVALLQRHRPGTFVHENAALVTLGA